MNWSKAKTIFIIAFLILNSFLGYQLIEKKIKVLEPAYMTENSLEEQLALRNIELRVDLSAEQPELSQLNAQFLTRNLGELDALQGQQITVEDHKIQSTFQQPITIQWPVELEQFQTDILDQYILKGDQYHYDRQYQTNIQYLQMINEHPIFVGTLTFEIEGEQVTGYEQVYYHVINTGTEQQVLSSFSSLRTLLDNQLIPPFSVITDVQLGYFGQVYDVDSQVLTPVWRMMFETEIEAKVIYVNAITGAIEHEIIQQ